MSRAGKPDRFSRRWSVLETLRPAQERGYVQRLWIQRQAGLYRVAVAALVAWGLHSLVVSDHGLFRWMELRREERELATKLATLKAESADLDLRLKESPTERGEREARERYHLGKKNEIVFFFDRDTAPADSAASSDTTATIDTNSPANSRLDVPSPTH